MAETPLVGTERSAREARALAEIVQRINQSLDLDRVFSLIVRHAAELLHARGARLGLVEEGTMVVAATHGDPDDLAVTADADNSVSVPCVANGLVIGAITVFDVPERRFDSHDEELLLSLANHAALALRNALLLERVEQRAKRLAAVASVQQAIAAAVSLAEVYAASYHGVASIVDASHFVLLRHDPVHGALVPEYVVTNGIEGVPDGMERVPLDHESRAVTGIVAAFRSGEPNVSPGSGTSDSAQLAHPGMAAVLSAPIVNGDQLLGVLQAQSTNPDAYDTEVVDIVMLIARQTGTAIARAQATAAERVANERSRALAVALDAMDQPVLIRSRDEIVLYANGAALREYGYTRDELIGLSSHALTVLPTVRAHDHTREAPRDDLAASGAWSGELLLRRKNGTEFAAWLSINNIVNDEGEMIASVITTRDLTEERRVAEQLRQSEKLVALGELVAGVAHEVNNPLTGISAFAQLLQEDHLTPNQLEAAQMIKREADRAVAVIRDLLTFARKTGPRSVPIDMNELIEQTMRLRTYGLRTAGIDLQLELSPSLPRVRGDDRQLQQVLLNLVVNAEHSVADCPTRVISLRTSAAGGRVIVEVSDTGRGMSAEVQKRIFEPFFTTKAEGTGTGLGLSVSFGIAQTHGGMLTVHSAPGAGATFRLTLPIDETFA